MNFDYQRFQKFSRHITGFSPYEYQAEVANKLMSGKNVILSVPTGAGKTWASIMPFLFAKNQQEIDFPKKMIYSLPLRALCNSIYLDVMRELERQSEFKNLSNIQTGEFSDDPYFESDMVFSTIDQTLSNFLCFPLALSQRQANINAGSLIGSYLVFDEFHLLDECRSMATTLGMLRMLGGLSRFCLMTATLSDEFMSELQKALPNVEVVTLDGFEEDVKKIGSLLVPENRKSKKVIEVLEGTINANKIIEYHQNKTIVICNRVESAQRVYLELEEWAAENKIKLVCLHSRFFDRERREYEKQLKDLFGKKSIESKRAVLIATQVIEAGMDISCEIMHTEIAPINALLQRVGRCARYTGEYGKIFVYDVLSVEEKAKIAETDFEDLSKEDKQEIRNLKNLYLPYEALLCKTTLAKLKNPNNQELNETVTTRLVNEILTLSEKENFKKVQVAQYNNEKIEKAWQDCLKSNYRSTIRDIQSTDVIIISEKSFAEKYPYSLEHISMFKWSLVKWIKEVLKEVDTEEDWVVGILEENLFLDTDIESGKEKLQFREIKDLDDVIRSFDTLYLNSKYFFYDKRIGFNKIKGQNFSSFKERKDKGKEVYAYRKDTFVQHTKGLLGAFNIDFLPKLDFPFQAFNKRLESKVDFKRLIQLILILHDYGKLDKDWQGWMQAYQKELSLIPDSIYTFEKGIPLGHTGFNTRGEKALYDDNLEKKTKEAEGKIYKKRGKRRPHSGVGAKVISDVLKKWLEDPELIENISKPASIAIARHHGVSNISYPSFKIPEENYKVMDELLGEYKIKTVLKKESKRAGELEEMEITEKDKYLLYLFLVRILRLCDQKATEDFEKYISE